MGSTVGLILAIIFGYGVGTESGFFTGTAIGYIIFVTHVQFWCVE